MNFKMGKNPMQIATLFLAFIFTRVDVCMLFVSLIIRGDKLSYIVFLGII